MDTNKHSKRLPSFNELTSNFSNSLQIDSSNQSSSNSTIPSSQQTPQPTQPQKYRHTPQKDSNTVPPPVSHPQPQSSHITTVVQAPPHSNVLQQQQQQQYPHQNASNPYNHQFGQIPPNQQVIHQRVPSNYPELTRFQFPPSDPNYIISPTSNQSTSGTIPTSFNPERRLSMQLPPYPSHHTKKNSYDSQTSLSALADVASFGNDDDSSPNKSNEYKGLMNLLHSIEKSLDKYRALNQVFSDIHYEFSTCVENSMKQHLNPEDSIKLLFDYTSLNNEPMNLISAEFLKKFISNIPLSALKASLQMNDEIHKALESWLNYREREDDEKKSKFSNDNKTTITHVQSVPQSQTSSSTNTTPNSSKNHNRQNSRSKILRHNRHQSLSGAPSFIKKPNTSSNSSSTSTSNIKNDNISLVVKPPKPVTDSSITQPPPIKGVFNEDLSIKSDQKCQQCGSDDTPEWRRGPYGSRSLCNACGLFYGKLIKKFGYDEAAGIMLKRKDQGIGDDRRIPIN